LLSRSALFSLSAQFSQSHELRGKETPAKSEPDLGLIIGAGIGGLVLVAAIIGGIVLFATRKKRFSYSGDEHAMHSEGSQWESSSLGDGVLLTQIAGLALTFTEFRSDTDEAMMLPFT
jgi:hypothetical protein